MPKKIWWVGKPSGNRSLREYIMESKGYTEEEMRWSPPVDEGWGPINVTELAVWCTSMGLLDMATCLLEPPQGKELTALGKEMKLRHIRRDTTKVEDELVRDVLLFIDRWADFGQVVAHIE